MKAHRLIHKGEKPFGCDKCLGKFRRRHHLNHHKCPKDEANLGKPRRGRRPKAYEHGASSTIPGGGGGVGIGVGGGGLGGGVGSVSGVGVVGGTGIVTVGSSVVGAGGLKLGGGGGGGSPSSPSNVHHLLRVKSPMSMATPLLTPTPNSSNTINIGVIKGRYYRDTIRRYLEEEKEVNTKKK